MGKKARRRKLLALANSNKKVETKPKEIQMNNGVTQVIQSDIKQLKSLGIVMSCVLTHKCVATQHKLTWNGGKLNPIWPEVLAFFKWTYTTHRSESQVRLFVNRATGEWKAWAFPQKARTGMTAHEIDVDDAEEYEKTKAQLVQFSDTDGWTYWGTAHHHCGGGAFQSGVDENNEKKQDGIHITVGYMDRNHHDIHFRLYMGGIRLDGNMTDFWDVGDTGVPEHMQSLMKDGWKEALTRHLMGVTCPADQTFPEIWKENVIDITPKGVVIGGREHGVYQPSFTPTWAQPNWRSILTRSHGEFLIDRQKAYSEIKQMMGHPQSEFQDLKEMLKSLEYLGTIMNDGELEIMDICMRNDLKPEQLYKYIVEQLIMQEKREEEWAKDKVARADKAKATTTKGMKKLGKVMDAQAIEEDKERAMRAQNEGFANGYYGWGGD